MTIQLRCVDKDRLNEIWTLDLDEDKAVFTDAGGVVVAALDPEEAVSLFRMPSFSESIKYFGLRTETGLRQFNFNKADLKQIKHFVNRTIAAAGPEAVAAVKRKAIRDLLIGGACVAGGIVVSVLAYVDAASNPEGGRYAIFYGVVFFGLIMVGKSIVGFKQYARLNSMT